MDEPHFINAMRKWLPHGLILLWLLFVGIAVWIHARKAVVPPLYDAFGYFQKGQNFWKDLRSKELVNPLDLPPTLRPPGTVLMSFPFGPSVDFRPFYFRSVFFPILCFVAAVYLAAFDSAVPVSEQWNLAILTAFLSTLPLFYHFEVSNLFQTPNFWGLVDLFFAGIAALAAGASVRSLRRRSLIWWVIAVLFGSFSLLVKPAGALIMATVDLAWACALLIEYRGANGETRRKLRRLLAFGSLAGAAVEGSVAALCLHSQYLSHENFVSGERSLHSFQKYLPVMIAPGALHLIIHTSFGHILPVTSFLVLLLGSVKWKTNQTTAAQQTPLGMVAAAGVTLVMGLWFWIVATRITEIRYFYPFGLMAIAYSVPLILTLLSRGAYRAIQYARIIWLIPCLNLALLLVQSEAPVPWRKLSGVSMVSGSGRSEVAQARGLIAQVRSTGKNAIAYALDIGLQSDIFASVADYAFILDPEKPRLTVKLPIAWESTPVFRLEDLEYSDFVLVSSLPKADAGLVLPTSGAMRDFATEAMLIRGWLASVTDDDGVVIVSNGPVRILQVTDSAKLGESRDRLVSDHSWPESFLEANPREWWTLGELQQSLSQFRPQATDVDFEGVFKASAIAIEHTQDSVMIRLWWQSTREYPGDWNFFCHIIDDSGKMLDNYATPLRGQVPLSQDRPIHFTVGSFNSPSIAHAYGVAVGIYKAGADGFILKADRGTRDWGGQRLILPFASVSAK
jgi:hypothetical protein